MIVSELKIYNFRRFRSVDGAPGLQITFHKGLNALIGENDSGKTAVIDALKLVLLTKSNEYIRPVDEDFYKPVDGDACSEFKIDCTISEFNPNEAKNFIEYLTFVKDGDKVEYTLELHYRAWKEGPKIYQELRIGDVDDGISIDGKARELLKAVYLKPLRDAEREMSSGRSSRISQILLNHPVFKDKKEHVVLELFALLLPDIYCSWDLAGVPPLLFLHTNAPSGGMTPHCYLLAVYFPYILLDRSGSPARSLFSFRMPPCFWT